MESQHTDNETTENTDVNSDEEMDVPGFSATGNVGSMINGSRNKMHNTFIQPYQSIQILLGAQKDLYNEMISIAATMKTKFRSTYPCEKIDSKLTHIGLLNNNNEVYKCKKISSTFEPSQRGDNPPTRILALDNTSYFGEYLAFLWGTRQKSVMNAFKIVFLIDGSDNSKTSIEQDIERQCNGLATGPIQKEEIFTAISQLNTEVLIIVTNLNAMSSKLKSLEKLFEFGEECTPLERHLRNATFLVTSPEVPTGLLFQKMLRVESNSSFSRNCLYSIFSRCLS